MTKYKIVAHLVDGRLIEVFFKVSSDIKGAILSHCACDVLKRKLTLENVESESVKTWEYNVVQEENI